MIWPLLDIIVFLSAPDSLIIDILNILLFVFQVFPATLCPQSIHINSWANNYLVSKYYFYYSKLFHLILFLLLHSSSYSSTPHHCSASCPTAHLEHTNSLQAGLSTIRVSYIPIHHAQSKQHHNLKIELVVYLPCLKQNVYGSLFLIKQNPN